MIYQATTKTAKDTTPLRFYAKTTTILIALHLCSKQSLLGSDQLKLSYLNRLFESSIVATRGS